MVISTNWKSQATFILEEEYPPDADLPPPSKTVITFDTLDLHIDQWFKVFERVLIAQGFSEHTIASGACGLAFHESRSKEVMRKVYNEYDLSEFHPNETSV
jgi:hypothetical protein